MDRLRREGRRECLSAMTLSRADEMLSLSFQSGESVSIMELESQWVRA